MSKRKTTAIFLALAMGTGCITHRPIQNLPDFSKLLPRTPVGPQTKGQGTGLKAPPAQPPKSPPKGGGGGDDECEDAKAWAGDTEAALRYGLSRLIAEILNTLFNRAPSLNSDFTQGRVFYFERQLTDLQEERRVTYQDMIYHLEQKCPKDERRDCRPQTDHLLKIAERLIKLAERARRGENVIPDIKRTVAEYLATIEDKGGWQKKGCSETHEMDERVQKRIAADDAFIHDILGDLTKTLQIQEATAYHQSAGMLMDQITRTTLFTSSVGSVPLAAVDEQIRSIEAFLKTGYPESVKQAPSFASSLQDLQKLMSDVRSINWAAPQQAPTEPEAEKIQGQINAKVVAYLNKGSAASNIYSDMVKGWPLPTDQKLREEMKGYDSEVETCASYTVKNLGHYPDRNYGFIPPSTPCAVSLSVATSSAIPAPGAWKPVPVSAVCTPKPQPSISSWRLLLQQPVFQ